MKKIHIDEQSANEFKKIRKIIGIIISSLEERISNINDNKVSDGQKTLSDFFPESGENIVSTLCKLGNLLVKLSCFKVDYAEPSEDFEEIDIDIMKNYIETLIDNRSKSNMDNDKF
jgi:hypothetical protein